MKILLVNTSDTGGAANACLRLHEGLLQNGIDSKVLLRHKTKNIIKTYKFRSEVKSMSFGQKVYLKIKRILQELKILSIKAPENNEFLKIRSRNLEKFSYPNSRFDITESSLYKEADIINLHWVADFLDYESFFKKNKKPVIWTLHDMNPFTGGEHYEEKYSGFNESGNPIDRFLTNTETKEFEKVIEEKRNIFRNVQNLHIVTLCDWMTGEVKKNSIFKEFPVKKIPNGLNSNIFSPRDLVFARELLGLPFNKKIILFVSDSIDNNRKGFQLLLKVFEQLNDSNLVLCSVGRKMNNELDHNNVYELGSIHDERLMSIAYSACDVFVIPSLIDNLPNTLIESTMCGTPVIGFNVGGISDIIEDGINGFLVNKIDVDSMVKAIKRFLDDEADFDREMIRKRSIEKFNTQLQAKRYIELFKTIEN